MKKLAILMMPILALAPIFSAVAATSAEDEALAEFEQTADQYRVLQEAIRAGLVPNSVKVQQYDTKATDVNPDSEALDYQSAVMDPYYGYKMFILVDKSKGKKSGRARKVDELTPQSLYIFARNGNTISPVDVVPVSTGLEPKPGNLDTRDGFFRLQSAQKTYTSRKFGSSMPFSLWFESEYGTAIHQTPQAACDSKIGLRASHGCVRLCPGDAEKVFKTVTADDSARSSAIVLLDKRTGVPMLRSVDLTKTLSTNDVDSRGMYTASPRVVRGFPVFIRIIDGTTPEKVEEMKDLLKNPTDAFRQYFKPFSQEAMQIRQSI